MLLLGICLTSLSFSAYYLEQFTPLAKATAAGFTVNYTLTDQQDGCAYIENTQCPLEEEEYVAYILTMPILKVFPKVPT